MLGPSSHVSHLCWLIVYLDVGLQLLLNAIGVQAHERAATVAVDPEPIMEAAREGAQAAIPHLAPAG